MLNGLDRHPNAKAVLSTPEPSHAYLFHGPGGSGKRAIARELAADWLAEGEAEPASAHARALAGSHPDLTWVTPSGAAQVLVSDIDTPVIAAVSKTPFESSRRVFVIEGADQMGDEAANRLLKTLEEPPAYVHIILIADQLAQVLPTIRSRCQAVRFEAPSDEQIAQELTAGGVPQDTAVAYAHLGLGDAGRARALAEPEGVKLREQSLALIRGAIAGKASQAGSWKPLLEAVKARGDRVRSELEERAAAEVALYPKKEQKRVENEWGDRIKRGQRRVQTGALDQALTLIESWLIDLTVLGLGADDLVRNSDRLDDLRADLAAMVGAGGADGSRQTIALRQAVELVEDTRQSLQLNVSEDLACEALTYRLERTLAH